MDLKDLLNQTKINIKNKEQIAESEPEPEPEPESEPEPEPEHEPESAMIDSRFLIPWNKLEKGMKMNRILLFIESEKLEKELSDQQTKDLKNLLFRGCDSGLFNKQSDVKYNIEEGIIESFKNLEFNESSKKYKLKTGGSKGRSVTKSRSNIDRLMKK